MNSDEEFGATTAVFRIPVDSIDIPKDRLRLVDESRVLEIVQSLLDVGQITPIEVAPADADGRYRLIVGAHRLCAARIAEFPTISTTIFEGTPDQTRLREIDENLYRHELTPLDQAAFLAERRSIYERIFGPIQAGRPSRRQNTARLAQLSFASETAKKFGLTRRTLERALARKSGISELVWPRLRGSGLPWKGTDLDALSRLSEPMQERVVALILNERTAKTVAAAVRLLSGTPDTAGKSPFDRFLRLWTDMGAADRDRVREFVAKQKKRG